MTYLDGDTLQVSALREQATLHLVRRARNLNVVLELYTPDAMYVERRTDISEAHAKMIGVNAMKRDLAEVAATEPVVRAQWVVPPERLADVMAVEVEGVSSSAATSPALPNTYFVSLTHAGVEKGSAVKLLAEKLELKPDQLMGIGDSPGDLGMLATVGIPRVLSSGDPEVVARYPDGLLPGVEACGAAQGLDEAIRIRVR